MDAIYAECIYIGIAVSLAFSVEMNKVANCAIWSVSLYDQFELTFGTLLGQVE